MTATRVEHPFIYEINTWVWLVVHHHTRIREEPDASVAIGPAA